MYRCLRKAEEGIRSSESEATGGCESWHKCQEPNSSPLQQQKGLSTAKPPYQGSGLAL